MIKKINILCINVLLVFTVFCFCGCINYTSMKYIQYYNITSKGGGGPNIYAWKIDDDNWRCAAFAGLNRGVSEEELEYFQNKLPCPLKEMKKILTTYSSKARESIVIYVVKYLQDSSDFDNGYYLVEDIPDTYKFLYSQLGLPIPDYL